MLGASIDASGAIVTTIGGLPSVLCQPPLPAAGCPSSSIAYVNSAYPALAIGGDIELRREWRQGWMVSIYYSYEPAAFIDSPFANPELVNAPQHLGAFKGVVPVLPDLLSFALRITLEAPRRINFPASGTTAPAALANSNVTTPPSAVADLTASGNIKRFGIGYVFGVYNVTDSRYVYPVSPSYLSSVMQQPGRTFLGDITVRYP